MLQMEGEGFALIRHLREVRWRRRVALCAAEQLRFIVCLCVESCLSNSLARGRPWPVNKKYAVILSSECQIVCCLNALRASGENLDLLEIRERRHHLRQGQY